MKRFLLPGIALIVVMIFSFGAAIAQPDQTSANHIMPGCRDVALAINFSKDEESKEDLYRMGFCAGIISGLSYMAQTYGICLPAGVTAEQATRVVVQFIDGQPARINENFMLLAVEALRGAWPCKK